MKFKTLLVCSLMILVEGRMFPADEPENLTILLGQGWGSGESFLAMSKGQQSAMASGIVSGLFMSPLMGAPECGPTITALSQCTRGMTATQLAAVVEKYLRDHPEKWNAAIAISAIASLEDACPRLHAAQMANGPAHASQAAASEFYAAHCPMPAPAAPAPK